MPAVGTRPTPRANLARTIFWTAVLAVYSYTLWLMLRIVLQYIPLRLDAAFLATKQDYVHLFHYRIAFFVHVFSSIFVLLAAFTQFSTRFRLRYRSWHRYLGRIYAYVVIFLAGPSGLVIGLYANGGFSSRIGFCLLAVLWVTFTLIALVKVRARQVDGHAHWMIRSYALALSAISLRIWKMALVNLFHPHPMDAYRIVAWLGWVLNLAVAEWIIFGMVQNKASRAKQKAHLIRSVLQQETTR